MGYIASRNGQYRKAECIFSDYDMGYIKRRYSAETGFTMPYLTFLYISFGKIFCQNFVKKNCKYVP